MKSYAAGSCGIQRAYATRGDVCVCYHPDEINSMTPEKKAEIELKMKQKKERDLKAKEDEERKHTQIKSRTCTDC